MLTILFAGAMLLGLHAAANAKVADKLDKTINAGDAEGFSALFTGDGVLVDPASGQTMTGKDQIKAWAQKYIDQHIHVVSKNYKVSGDAKKGFTVTWTSKVKFDLLGKLGISEADGGAVAVIVNDKVKSFSPHMSADVMAKINAALAKMNKDIVAGFMEEIINKGNVDAMDKYVSADFVDHNPFPGQPPTAQGLKDGLGMFRKAFPDFHATTEDLLMDGDKVVVRGKSSGTLQGEFMGQTATGKKFEVGEIHIIRVKDGKIIEHWGLQDGQSMAMQLGLGQPVPGGEKKDVPALPGMPGGK